MNEPQNSLKDQEQVDNRIISSNSFNKSDFLSDINQDPNDPDFVFDTSEDSTDSEDGIAVHEGLQRSNRETQKFTAKENKKSIGEETQRDTKKNMLTVKNYQKPTENKPQGVQ